MSLQLKFFVIPIRGLDQAEDEINRFLRSVRVVNSQREFVPQGENSFWCMAVEYLVKGACDADGRDGTNKKARIDYNEVLSAEASLRR